MSGTSPKVLDIETIKQILSEGDFDKFIGKIEGDYFEAKQQLPYRIDSSSSDERFTARIELAGDVASMANGKGGYIVCGLPTDPELDLQTDIVKQVDLLAQKTFYTQESIQEVLKAHVVPELDVTVVWYSSKGDASKGLGSIFVPPQPESKKHFLVTAVEVDGVRQKHFVAIPVRQGSVPVWRSAKEIYRHAASKKPNELKQVHDSLASQIEELRDIVLTGKGVSTPADDLQRKIKEVLDVH